MPSVGIHTPGFDPVTQSVPSAQPDKTFQSLKDQAKALREQRRRQGTDLTPSQKAKFAELKQAQTQQSGALKLHTKPGFRSAATAALFGMDSKKVCVVEPMPALSTEEEIVVAAMNPEPSLIQTNQPVTEVNGQSVSFKVAQQQKDRFDDAMSEGGVYAGLANMFWGAQKDGTYQHCIFDTSGSMSWEDGERETLFRKDEDDQKAYMQIERLRNEWQIPRHNQGKMVEMKSRLINAFSDLFLANTNGTVYLETFSPNRFGTETISTKVGSWDSVEGKYQKNLSQAINYVRQIEADDMGTPTLSYLNNAFKAAEDEGRLDRTRVLLMTDGAPGSEHIAEVDRDFADYERRVVMGSEDFINKKGIRVPNEVARLWYMDEKTRPIDRKISFLIGQYAVPVVIGACTNNKKDLGELNEMDTYHTGGYSRLAVLDDQISEAKETSVHNPWFNFTPKTSNIGLWMGDEPEFDILDERPAAPLEKEKILGYQAPLDEAEIELKATELGQRSKFEADRQPKQAYVPYVPTASSSYY